MPITEFPAGAARQHHARAVGYLRTQHLSAQSVVSRPGPPHHDAPQARARPQSPADGRADLVLGARGDCRPTRTAVTWSSRRRRCAALTKLSDEVVTTGVRRVLDTVGHRDVAAVALKADRAILAGTGGKQPLGVFGQAGQHVTGAVNIDPDRRRRPGRRRRRARRASPT